jgi:hypothetical protein
VNAGAHPVEHEADDHLRLRHQRTPEETEPEKAEPVTAQ